MTPLAALVPVLGYTMLLGRIVPGRPELALLGAVSGLVIAAYGAALAGLLEPVSVSMFWLGCGLAVVLPFVRARSAPPAWSDLANPAIVLFVAWSVVHGLLFAGARYVYWDEFSHWGLAAKDLLQTGRLWDGAGTVREFAHYPPGTALWQYFVARNTTNTEAAILFAQFLLFLAPTMTLYRHVSWRSPGWLVAVLALQILLLANLGLGPSILYVDHVLATLLGGILVAHLAERPRPVETALLVLPCACLALVKEIGVVLAIGAVVWIAVDLACFGAAAVRGPSRVPGPAGIRPSPRWARLLPVAAMIVAIVAVQASWGAYRERHDLGRDAPQLPGAGRVLEVLGGARAPHQETTIARYWEVLATQQVRRSPVSERFNEFSWDIRGEYPRGFHLSAVGYVALSVLLLAARAALAARGRATLAWTAAAGALGFGGYASLLLVLYLFAFRPDQAEVLASWVRYTNTALLPLTLVALAAWLPAGGRFGWRSGASRAGPTVAAAVLAFLVMVETPHLAPLHRAQERMPLRDRVAGAAARVKASVPAHAPLVVIPPVEDNGFFQVLLRYELSPLRPSFEPPASVGALPADAYVWYFALDDSAATRVLGTRARLFRTVEGGGRRTLDAVW